MKGSDIIINNDKEMSHWHVILKQWISLIKIYCDFMNDGDNPTDSPYFYNERANIGLLSGAAWKAGWIALEEFGCKKRGKKQARCDLYIYPRKLGKENYEIPERGEYIEAKICWTKFKEKGQSWSLKNIKMMLDEANKNAQSITQAKAERAVKIGVLFVVPYINKQFKTQINQYISELYDNLLSIPCDAFAFSFPKNLINLNGGGLFKNYIFPGIFLLAQLKG